MAMEPVGEIVKWTSSMIPESVEVSAPFASHGTRVTFQLREDPEQHENLKTLLPTIVGLLQVVSPKVHPIHLFRKLHSICVCDHFSFFLFFFAFLSFLLFFLISFLLFFLISFLFFFLISFLLFFLISFLLSFFPSFLLSFFPSFLPTFLPSFFLFFFFPSSPPSFFP